MMQFNRIYFFSILQLSIFLCLLLCACANTNTKTNLSNIDPLNNESLTDISADIPENLPDIWKPLAIRLAKDGVSGKKVNELLLSLGNTYTQDPMGRKMRELYSKQFIKKTPSQKPTKPETIRYYKGVVNQTNAQLCRDYISTNIDSFIDAEQKYGVPPSIAASLLFVETRLGKILGDVPENAFKTLASMSICRDISTINLWLNKMPNYEKHLDWFAQIMPKRADWAYKEVKALIEHMVKTQANPENYPGSIYGAVGLCQFMPSNIPLYGADGNDDGQVDLFLIPDAIASLSNYLAKHGWKKGISKTRQHELLMTYNHAKIYANTILALAELVEDPDKQAPSSPPQSPKKPKKKKSKKK